MLAAARRQHGVVGLAEAAALGYSRNAMSRLVTNGTLRRVFPRTYAVVGAGRSPEHRAMTAVVWAGDGATVSHQTAAAFWGIAPRVATPVHVTCVRNLSSPPRGIATHRLDPFPRRDRGSLRGVPITSVARTLLDLAATSGEVAALVERAVVDDLVTVPQLVDILDRNRGRRGAARLRAALDGGAVTSALERRVAAILRGSGLPPFVREFPVGRCRLDFAWPDRRVAIEADGRRWHSSRNDFARDRAKHNALVAAGWRVLRVTWDDADDSARVVAEVTGLLAVS